MWPRSGTVVTSATTVCLSSRASAGSRCTGRIDGRATLLCMAASCVAWCSPESFALPGTYSWPRIIW
uniref:Putative secreted peptide n=1 Tax=Anopheles braziliensis TaxID=58242 RepID=A0A2M3ZX75_9DIPT